MADDNQGGVVTVVKEGAEVSKDLDFQERLGQPLIDDEQPTEPEKKKDVPAAEEEFDPEKLSPAARKEFNRLNAANRRKERELRDMRDRDQDERPRRQQEKPKEPAAEVVALEKPKRPKAQDFTKDGVFDEAGFEAADEEYGVKLAQYVVDDNERKRRENDQNASTRKERETIIKTFEKNVVDFMEEHADYETVMDNDIPMSDLMFAAVLEEGPHLGYYLASHEAETRKIFAMDRRGQQKALTRVLVKLEDEAEAAKKKIPKKDKEDQQPEPATPVGGRARMPEPVKSKERMSFAEREKKFAKDNPGVLKYEP